MHRRKFSNLFRFGVRQKVLLILMSVLLIGLTISGWMALKQEERNTLKDINQRGSDISRFVAKSLAYSVVGYDYHTVQLLLDEITFAEDIGYAKVVNFKGNTMAESGDGKNPNIVIFNQDIRLEDEIVGNLTLGLSTENILQRLESQKFALIKREAFVIFLIALGEFLALSFIIIRPVSIMSESLNDSVDESGRIIGKVPVISEDEFGKLAQQFNMLSAQLNDANLRLQSKIDLADKQLIKNNRQLVQQSEELQRINEEFRKMSVTDSLTGLHNRRHFEELMKTELEMSLRHGDVSSVLVIDIDHFKKINDRYGHPGGDAVLKQIAGKLKANLRKTDILCRVGGEEFVALCKRADRTAALAIGEKMRRDIESTAMRFGDEKINVTISVGIATTNELNVSQGAEELYRQADAAVYHSKDQGRNRITHYDDLLQAKNTQATAG
ncbi:MAG: diguanylate cyclase [Gammaproteobacteria bacterium]|nr:diguanylate cyclase [Gammaproteobacteria bacterium]